MIILYKIRFPQEIRDINEFKLPTAKEVNPAELKIALALIKQFAGTFKPDKYKDEYSAELMKIIRSKAAGKRAKVKKLVTVKTKSTDLMAQLKASLQNKKRAS